LGSEDVVAARSQPGPERPEDGDLVVDDQDLRHGQASAAHAASADSTGGPTSLTGRRNTKVAPPPRVGSIQIWPPWAATMPRQMARPIPTPPDRRPPGTGR